MFNEGREGSRERGAATVMMRGVIAVMEGGRKTDE